MKPRFFLSALIGLALIGSTAWAGSFGTGKNDPGNTVTFKVSAPLETIVGTSPAIGGHLKFDPDNVKASSGGRFEVDVAAFNTGVGLRDEHFRDNFLHTDKYPKAVFTLDRVVRASRNKVKSGESVELEAEGTLKLHGVEKKEQVKATVTYLQESEQTRGVMPGNLLAFTAHFRIKLADYNIERPQMLVLKVGEVVDVDTVVRMTDSASLSAGDGGGK